MNVLQKIDLPHTAKNVVISGSCASVLSAAALAVCSKRDQNRFAAGMNGPSQWLRGKHAGFERKPSLKGTLVGYLIHHVASTFWAAVHVAVFRDEREKSVSRILTEAAGASVAAYVVDYHLTPKRLRPGFEKHVSSRSMVLVYAAFAAGLAAAALLSRKDS